MVFLLFVPRDFKWAGGVSQVTDFLAIQSCSHQQSSEEGDAGGKLKCMVELLAWNATVNLNRRLLGSW